MTVPETPSPDQPRDGSFVIKKEHGNIIEGGARKRHHRMHNNNNQVLSNVSQNGSQAGSTYSEICSLAAQHFGRIREVLVERSVTSALNSGFLTPYRERLMVALGLELFTVNDEKFMDMFVAPGAIDILQNEQQSLHKRQKILHSCLTEFKSVARSL
ncbi:putative Dynamin superfamily [Helianthus annuus]|uniref:Dynamin superfamily n=1 Tax=Helianthus annuus TaxID=4232 RepID=A0A251U6H7_HELAN|nr:putative Dynamin superfamily [Helianthus annuus]KAJ0546652.1 putative Dynamin superfamily [Helianthus annuus]KAJ0553332.1 putative Dynamin superfamily [Helianthus annuus]KAJ0722242.1 putative Dynamin superfamily [Helianthus annuus]KAJ0796662.1 putative Dynamin superfamily [Helianthus annuus]